MNYNIHIIGSGFAGLTVAHLLTKKRPMFNKITVYDACDFIGGKAGEYFDEQGYFRNHAPRVFLGNFMNMFGIFDELGISDHMYDIKADYIILDGKEDQKEDTLIEPGYIDQLISHMDPIDLPMIGYYMSRGLVMCDERIRDEYEKILLKDIIKGKNTIKLFSKLVNVFGDTLDTCTVYKLFRMFEYDIKSRMGEYEPYAKKGSALPLYVFDGPLNIRIFNPWQSYLKLRGIEFKMNHKLKEFKKNEYLMFDNNYVVPIHESRDIIVFALNMEALSTFFMDLKGLKDMSILWEPTFQVYFNDKITSIPSSNVMIDDFIIQPLDRLWTSGDYTNGKSTWSVNVTNTNGRSIDELRNALHEVLITRLGINPSSIKLISPWPHNQNYFVSLPGSSELRPSSHRRDNGIYITGAIIDTPFYAYFAEGAVTSGYQTIQSMYHDYGISGVPSYYPHDKVMTFRILQDIDKELWISNLPSVIFLFIFLLIVFSLLIMKS